MGRKIRNNAGFGYPLPQRRCKAGVPHPQRAELCRPAAPWSGARQAANRRRTARFKILPCRPLWGRPPSGQDGLRGNSLPRGYQRPQGRQALHTAGRHSRRHQRPLRHQAPHTAGWTPPIAAPKARLRRWPIPCGMGRKIRNNAGFGWPLSQRRRKAGILHPQRAERCCPPRLGRARGGSHNRVQQPDVSLNFSLPRQRRGPALCERV